MRRFFDTDDWNQAFRKLESKYKVLWFYIWKEADYCGVYTLDWDYLNLETGEKYAEKDFKIFGEKCVKIRPGKFLLIDFILVNYGTLRENYNPHKPVFRDLLKNNLKINSSLNQALFKLEEEEEDKDKEEGEDNIKKESDFIILETIEELNVWPTFEDFWDEYDKKVDKKASVKLWEKLQQIEKEKIMIHVPDYVNATPDVKFRKDPKTYLHNRSWENTIYGQTQQADPNQFGKEVDELINAKYRN
jgi:hypothetical protein